MALEMIRHGLESLPDELKSHILSYLINPPPSWSWQKNTLDTGLTRSSDLADKPLKSMILVSKTWYRLVSPLLYAHLQLRLEDTDQTTPPLLAPRIKSISANFREWLFRDLGYPHDVRLPYRHVWQSASTEKAAKWTATLEQQLASLFAFLESPNNGSNSDNVQSLTVIATDELNNNGLDYIRDEVHCLIATDAFWNLLFEKLDPARVTVLAPPSKLACLLGCSMNMMDAWAFPGMAMQLVSVWREPRPVEVNDHRRSPSGSDYDMMHPVELVLEPNEYGRPAFSSFIYIRPWTHLAVNEGSFLEAYSTYEYFHKNPPGILASVGRAFRLEMDMWSVSYKAVFPFGNHIGSPLDRITYKGNSSNVRKLYVKIAPDPDDTILDDPAQVGKADITDCWREVESAYRFLTDPALRGEPDFTESGTVRELEMFGFGDSSISSIRETVASSMETAGWQEKNFKQNEPGLTASDVKDIKKSPKRFAVKNYTLDHNDRRIAATPLINHMLEKYDFDTTETEWQRESLQQFARAACNSETRTNKKRRERLLKQEANAQKAKTAAEEEKEDGDDGDKEERDVAEEQEGDVTAQAEVAETT
ncbi:hypothetical protein D6D13_03721 [Aureobasidium pullulans]|uniref:Uncharacterized protein n=1 Tax=Aureobasidium pullulans TaxID=5580 RepID=A0A4V4J1N2_AURPU|nr:hypothetical protein D6D13_03721 [Aureobasidium pullulans]